MGLCGSPGAPSKRPLVESSSEGPEQHTQEALRELYNHVNNMPESAKKKKLMRQVGNYDNDEGVKMMIMAAVVVIDDDDGGGGSDDEDGDEEEEHVSYTVYSMCNAHVTIWG